MKTIDLDGNWQLRWFDGMRGDSLKRVINNVADLERAWVARVPGSVHETLVEHGVIPEPNLGTNVLACRWVEEMFWIYRRTFAAPKLRSGERAWLVFDCLDLAATICLNGREVGRQANAFHPCRVEVTDALAAGENTLVVQVESGLFHARHKSMDGCSVMGRANHELTRRAWLRKPQNQHDWDWAPRLLNVGISGHVRLEIAKGVRWDQGVVLADLSADRQHGTVTARVFAEGLDARPVTSTLVVKVAGREHRTRVTIQPGMNCLETTVTVPQPALWWPVGHGEQPLYTVEVTLTRVGSMTRKVGFRRVKIDQSPHPERGYWFIVEVNGKRIFCKGGNFVPADLIISRIDRRRYETLIDLALESHFNMLRVWGGGLYESDDFFDLCDERGILVWQEFIFACAQYPGTDRTWLRDVKQEATWQIRRLAHHASLVIWCGNNEMEWFNWAGFFGPDQPAPDHELFHHVLPRLLKAEDPGRYYQPSSPYSPGLQDPFDGFSGDQHPWGVGMGEVDFRKYREMVCRFPNEGGLLGPTSLPTVRACTDRVGDFAWELHDNSVSYWDNVRPYAPDALIEHWTGKRVRDLDLDEYVYWGGLVQGAGLGEYIKNFRRRKFDCAAAVFWMYNDVWPCTRSWTTVDYCLRRTPAFWPVKRAMAPTIVVVTREADTIRIYGVTDGEPLTASLRFGLMDLAGGYPSDETVTVRLEGNASALIAELDARVWDRLGTTTHVAFAQLLVDGQEVARDVLILPLYREMKWPKARVRVRVKDGQAIFTSSTFAFRVCLDLDGEQKLPDNFLDVWPGIPTVLDWPEGLGVPKVLFVGNGMVSPQITYAIESPV